MKKEKTKGIKIISSSYNPSKSESKWQKFWEREGIYKFGVKSRLPVYSIDTPPPTVSGKIHIGHIFSYTQAEVVARYKRMSGYNVFYPFGFDNNGLPTERLVEKELNIKSNQLDRDKFIKQCFGIIKRYQKEFEKIWKSIGLSVDWTTAYSTISPFVQKISQKSFLELFKKGYLKRKSSPAIWCTECQTSIAQAEVDDKIFDTIFYKIKFYLKNKKEIAIATTRPELLPSCVSVFVNPKDSRYTSLIGEKIVTPLGDEVKILSDEKVDPDKGTGIVMCCTYGDEADMLWVKKYKLPEKIIITKDGKINNLNIKEARKNIIQKLESGKHLLSSENIKHEVRVHERCGTPIEILSVQQWFIEILSNKNKFVKMADKINWYPEYMKKRYIQWVTNLKWDWCISRQRIFGIPIPVWYSRKTGKIVLPDDDQLPIDPRHDFPKKLPKGHTKNDLIPDYDVLDTWATSALTPQINNAWIIKYNTRKSLIPMSLRPQAHDIIRTWAFYTIVKSVYHNRIIPWKDIMISGHVLTPERKKISKSKSNIKINPKDAIINYSADAIRYWACGSSLGKNIVFNEREVLKGKKLVTKLWNASRFVVINLNDYKPKKNFKIDNLTFTDRWALLKLGKTILSMTRYLNNYEVGLARIEFEKFFWQDFCDYYLEIIKDRVYRPDKYINGKKKRESAQYTMYKSLLDILKLMSPYMPHVTEEIYQNYFINFEKIKSIHLAKYPDVHSYSFPKEKEIFEGMNLFLTLIQEMRKFKNNVNMKLSHPLKRINVEGPERQIKLLSLFHDDILGVTRTEDIYFKKASHFGFKFTV